MPFYEMIFGKKRIALVLGSGGSKGIAHISVIEYLESLDIPIDMIIGSSIGAVVGGIYSAGVLKEFKEDLLKMSRREMMAYFDPVFPKSGLIEGVKIIDYLGKFLPDYLNIEDLPIPMKIIATNLHNGKTVIFKKGNLLKAIRASISIPGIFIPVLHEEALLVDGAVSNPLPIDVAQETGATHTIAVNLNKQIHGKLGKKHLKERKSAVLHSDSIKNVGDKEIIKNTFLDEPKEDENWLQGVEKWLGIDTKKKDEKTIPNIFDIMYRSIEVMGHVNTMLILKFYSPTVLIEPDVEGAGTLDFSKASGALNAGFYAAKIVRTELINKIGIRK